jgi:hypothetical protein
MPDETPTLYMFEGSNACLSAMLLLDHVQLPHRRRRLPPGLHAGAMRAMGFRGTTVPALRIGSRKVQGSRAIALLVADELAPEAGLLPAGAAEREQVLHLEARAEQLQNAARRLVYVAALQDTDSIRALVDVTYGRLPSPARALVVRALVPLASKGHAARADRAEGYIDRACDVLDELDAAVEAGVLATDAPTVADFQAAPNIAALALAPALAPLLQARPSWRIAEQLLPGGYPLDAAPDLPAAWVERFATRQPA